MTCEGCIKDVSGSLYKLNGERKAYMKTFAPERLFADSTGIGITRVEANLKEQLVAIEGTAPPSSIVAAIQDTGRDAILRGSGMSNSTNTAPPLHPHTGR